MQQADSKRSIEYLETKLKISTDEITNIKQDRDAIRGSLEIMKKDLASSQAKLVSVLGLYLLPLK